MCTTYIYICMYLLAMDVYMCTCVHICKCTIVYSVYVQCLQCLTKKKTADNTSNAQPLSMPSCITSTFCTVCWVNYICGQWNQWHQNESHDSLLRRLNTIFLSPVANLRTHRQNSMTYCHQPILRSLCCANFFSTMLISRRSFLESDTMINKYLSA